MQTELNYPKTTSDGFKLAVWAMGDHLLHWGGPAIDGECTIVYSQHWGEEEVSETAVNPTFHDLHMIASRLIERSGDEHHVFIENFTNTCAPGVVHDHPCNVWELHTGS